MKLQEKCYGPTEKPACHLHLGFSSKTAVMVYQHMFDRDFVHCYADTWCNPASNTGKIHSSFQCSQNSVWKLNFCQVNQRKVSVKHALIKTIKVFTERWEKKALLGSMSLARTWDAPLITAAIAVAPHPLPRSKTDRPLTTRGLSRMYLDLKGRLLVQYTLCRLLGFALCCTRVYFIQVMKRGILKDACPTYALWYRTPYLPLLMEKSSTTALRYPSPHHSSVLELGI